MISTFESTGKKKTKSTKKVKPEVKSLYNLTQRLKKKAKQQEEIDKEHTIDNEDDSLTCAETELECFLNGNPISFINLIRGIPIKISLNVKKSLYYDSIGMGMLTWIQYKQTQNRIIVAILASKGLKYNELPQLLGTSSCWGTINNSKWNTYKDAHETILDMALDEAEKNNYGRIEICSDSPFAYDKLVENHQEFLRFLNRHSLTFDDWVQCMISAFVSDGLYIPFNTAEEIIRCAKVGSKKKSLSQKK
jgi:hypothetical protein